VIGRDSARVIALHTPDMAVGLRSAETAAPIGSSQTLKSTFSQQLSDASINHDGDESFGKANSQ